MGIIFLRNICTSCYTNVGNGKKTPFWHALGLNGRAPKDIALTIFEISKRNNWMVSQALVNDAWIRKINLAATFSFDNLPNSLTYDSSSTMCNFNMM
jgi:hypothetical protein